LLRPLPEERPLEKDRLTSSETDLPLSVLIDSAPDGFLIVDSAGLIVRLNRKIEELFGYERRELIGETVEKLVPERLRQGHLGHRQQYERERRTRPMGLGLSLLGRRKDGSEFPVEISLSPVAAPQGRFVSAVVRDVSDRLRLEQERSALTLELETERERQRIGMDLHDGIMQEIYAAALTLDVALVDLRDRPDVAESEIERSIAQLHEVIRNIRSYIFDLRPREFAGSLSGALTELAREFRQNTQIEVTEYVPDLVGEVTDECAAAAYHIVHEALSNVRKHADASRVSLRVSEGDEHVSIEVNDNGRGFDASEGLPQVHRGLRNMDARARDVGCYLEVRSAVGKGTCIELRLPILD
jgi:PAS domain S-box-containing protein